MTELIKNNNLQNEKSIYLVQHAKNPVNWFPYGPEALQKAKDEDKPIFLSIGHSSCHWCHVMSEESFTDLPTAEILNENFVCIKVDREELPDIDQYYQLACQIMNGRGGWPLSAFLTPNMQPFFIGTYFPKAGTQEVPSFLEVLGHIQKDFKENRETINTNAAKITETLNQPPTVEHKVDFEGHYPTAASIINAMKNFQDDDFGGYGSEPKFPQYSFLEWGVEHILEGMVPEELGGHLIKTIEQFMIGGLYDHAKGGPLFSVLRADHWECRTI